jgi:hypothetical protein
MIALAPIIGSLVGPQGGVRRMLVYLPSLALLTLNHKLGLELSVPEQGFVVAAVLGVVIVSNLKEALMARALYAGQATAAVALHGANARAAAAMHAANVEIARGTGEAPKPGV